jgi:hypothetical protein
LWAAVVGRLEPVVAWWLVEVAAAAARTAWVADLV